MIEIPRHIVEKVVEIALEEDLPYGDITTDFLEINELPAKGFIKAKEKFILAGIDIAGIVFEKVDPLIHFTKLHKDGDEVDNGEVIAIVGGRAGSIFKGERVALNILSHMSGIATLVHEIVTLLKEGGIKLLDTRKTLPGLRALEKYAVLVGGGFNHRFSLSDALLIKSNHVNICGSVLESVKRAKKMGGACTKVEVEVRNIEEVKEALKGGADIIMLDNMEIEDIKKALKLINGRAEVEISGRMEIEKIKKLKNLKGINYISMGSITHSARAVDMKMEIFKDEG